MTSMQHTAHVPPVDFQTNGHRAWPLRDGIPALPAPKAPALARFEQVTLDIGVKFAWRQEGNRLHVGYDPAQIDALTTRLAVGIYTQFTENEKVDKLVELARDAEADASREIFTILLSHIDKSGDVKGVLAAAGELLNRAYNENHPGGRCPRYGWCIETGEHVEHTSDSIEPDFLDVDRGEVLAATITHWGNKGVRVGFLGEDLTPAEARTKVAEVRAHLDAVEQVIATAEASE
ncbi:hypothetical protein [Streptomyces cinereoruber]|uniref:hypothetical protein n=1 Tax=Streptomyces cinereoruber TaxID=67260 RepID=UPI003668C9F5